LKRLASIGLLALLLYNMFGLSFAILLFENDYQVSSASQITDAVVMKMHLPSLPYSGDLQISEQIQGLVRQNDQFYNPTHVSHENDTLYVTLESNQAARDHFFELANAIQLLNDPQTDIPQNPYGKAIKQLGSLLKIYISSSELLIFESFAFKPAAALANWSLSANCYLSVDALLTSPPPESFFLIAA
jgi:hypothetical protein